jgi:hypothetical protein
VLAIRPEDVPQTSSSSFRDLLVALRPDPVRRILDVGAGGFLGATTTVHLLELFPNAQIDAVEINPERARELADKFPTLNVHAGDVREYDAEPYDLAVVDLDSTRIDLLFDELLHGKLLELTRPGSLAVVITFTDVLAAFSGPRAMHPSNAENAAGLMHRTFGRLRITDDVVKRAFETDPDFTALTVIEKFRGDPQSFVGWIALERRIEEAKVCRVPVAARATRAGVGPEAAGLLEASDYRALDIVGDRGACRADCAALISAWSGWAGQAFGGAVSASNVLDEPETLFDTPPGPDATVIIGKVPMALLDVATDDRYRDLIGAKSRNMLRKVQRAGYAFETFEYNDHLDDLYAINTSKDERSGGPMTDAYRERPEPTRRPDQTCAHHHKVYMGAFAEGHLWGYCQLVTVGDLAIVNRFLGHAERLPDGIMNGLVAALVAHCREHTVVRAINYLTLHSSTVELDRFKRSVGFRPRAGVLAVLGPEHS